MVKKAIIAAAGNGTRFLPVTKTHSKELIPILNKPIIHYLVHELLGAGIKDICIIHRPGDQSIKNYFSTNEKLQSTLKKENKLHFLEPLTNIQKAKPKFTFLPQPDDLPYGTGAPVLTAKEFIANDPFVYLYGDDLVLEKTPGTFLNLLLKNYKKYTPQAIFGCQEVSWSEVDRYGSIRFKKDGQIPYQIEAVEEALPAGQAPSNFTLFGRFVVSPKVFNFLKNQKTRAGAARSSKKELLFTDTMKAMAQKGIVIAQPTKGAKWLTTGDPERWLKANLEFHQFLSKS